MNWLDSPLVRALRDADAMQAFSVPQWDLAIRQARNAGLLGRLGLLVQARAQGLQLPEGAQRHFTAAACIVARQHNAVRWEVTQISRALQGTGVNVTLLKGGAYAASGGPAAAGRTFNDVDILVPKARLADVEHALHVHGWMVKADTAYDDRYYRQWMHELPPMVHVQRGTALDVHHNLLPETARIQTRPELVMGEALALAQWSNVCVPTLADQILHSACHLFHEGEWGHGLRDLNDLHLMLGAYRADGGSGASLVARAEALNLVRPLAYAVRCTATVFATSLPAGLADALAGSGRHRWMDPVFMRAFSTAHHSMRAPGAGMAESALYVRSHWLRMPLRLLLPHLVHQATARRAPP
jgi:hypothetical protein